MANNSDSGPVKPSSGTPLATGQRGLLTLVTKWNPNLEITAKFVENIAKLIGYPLVIILVGAVVVKTITGDRKGRISLDPVTVPKFMEEKGNSGVVAATEVIVKINELQDKVRQNNERFATEEKFEFEQRTEPTTDIALPQSGISLTSAITFLEESLGRAPKHVHAEVVSASGTEWHDNAPNPIVICVELTGGESSSTQVNVQSFDEAFQRTALEVLKITEPFLMGISENEPDPDIAMGISENEEDPGNVEDALKLMKRASAQEPSNPEVYVAWGYTLTRKRDFDGAIAKYEQALKRKAKYALAYGYWANALLQKGDFDGAIKKCQKALELNPKYADAYGYWGNALQSKREYDKAIEKYQLELELNPESEYAHADLGNALRGKRAYDPAIAEYIEQLQLHPKNADAAYGNWGYALLLKQDDDEAIKIYKRELAHNSKNADAYSNWGCALQGKGDYKEAIAKYKHALELDPNYVDAYSNLGNALQGRGDYEGAIAEYLQALALDPNSADVYSNWSDAPLLVAFECSSGC